MKKEELSRRYFIKKVKLVHGICLNIIRYVNVGFHSFVVAVSRPFHDHLCRDSESQRIADELSLIHISTLIIFPFFPLRSLSFSCMARSVFSLTICLILSYCFSCVAMAMPNAADIELDACPAMKASYSLSAGFGNPLNPLSLRQV